MEGKVMPFSIDFFSILSATIWAFLSFVVSIIFSVGMYSAAAKIFERPKRVVAGISSYIRTGQAGPGAGALAAGGDIL